MYCQNCIVVLHAQNPTHRIQVSLFNFDTVVCSFAIGMDKLLVHRSITEGPWFTRPAWASKWRILSIT
jgi:hypothetical protein